MSGSELSVLDVKVDAPVLDTEVVRDLTVEALEDAHISTITTLNCLKILCGKESDFSSADIVVNETGCRLSLEPLYVYLDAHKDEVPKSRSEEVQQMLVLVSGKIRGRLLAEFDMAKELTAGAAGADDSGGIGGKQNN
ncbi:hypothetical protein KKF55_00685 [Patescibacteria group bacterium]|nr:hypothetical protein [Patescibacteria group bacterium]